MILPKIIWLHDPSLLDDYKDLDIKDMCSSGMTDDTMIVVTSNLIKPHVSSSGIFYTDSCGFRKIVKVLSKFSDSCKTMSIKEASNKLIIDLMEEFK